MSIITHRWSRLVGVPCWLLALVQGALLALVLAVLPTPATLTLARASVPAGYCVKGYYSITTPVGGDVSGELAAHVTHGSGVCALFGSGTWRISHHVNLWPGTGIVGRGRSYTTIKASGWDRNNTQFDSGTGSSTWMCPSSQPTCKYVGRVTLNGAGMGNANLAGGNGVLFDHDTLRNSACAAIVVNGPGLDVEYSTIKNSGETATANCSTPNHTSSAIYLQWPGIDPNNQQNNGPACQQQWAQGFFLGCSIYPTTINGSLIDGATIYGIDAWGVSGNYSPPPGPEQDVHVFNTTIKNANLGAISVVGGSMWRIKDDNVGTPANITQPANDACWDGPNGVAGVAGIKLCSWYNTIQGCNNCPSQAPEAWYTTVYSDTFFGASWARGYYGLMTGGDLNHTHWASNNTFQNNKTYGSIVGCIEMHGGSNYWSQNDCTPIPY